MIRYRTLGARQLWDKTEEETFNKNEFFQREAFDKLKKNINTQKVEIIYGPRQSGKTTLFMFLIDYLNTSGVKDANTWYVNLDLISDYTLFEKPENFIYLYDKLQVKDRVYLFIDEIQRLQTPGLFLKGIYDSRRNIKVFVSGSASFEIKAKVKEFLTGRKRLHLILPLSIKEVLKAKGVIPAELFNQKISRDNIRDWLRADEVYRRYLEEELENVMIYGLYPGVYALDDTEAKLTELDEIYNSYLKKDVFDYFKIERPEVFNNLVKVLAHQVGNVINISELCSLLSGSRNTIERYLGILEDTFVISLVNPFTSNKRSEVKVASKVYFNDPGLRNFALKSFSSFIGRPDKGSMIENLVFVEMEKNLKLLDDTYYWRTKSKAEVDFIYSRENRVIPVEVKTGSAKIGTLTRSFHSFIDTYNPRKAVFLNRDKFGHLKVSQTDVYYVPIYWFLLTGINSVT
jgi:predicted AAA+ superfamily ATPase